jgi:hypothetical protein
MSDRSVDPGGTDDLLKCLIILDAMAFVLEIGETLVDGSEACVPVLRSCNSLRRTSRPARACCCGELRTLLVQLPAADLGPCPEGATQASPGQRPGSCVR